MPTFTEIGTAIGQLVEKKNAAYGNAFAESCKILEVLFPNGVPVEKYTDLLTITRILDKLFRIATDKDAFNEEPFKDIAGYAILAVQRQQHSEPEDTTQDEPRLDYTVLKCPKCGKGYAKQYEINNGHGMCGTCFRKEPLCDRIAEHCREKYPEHTPYYVTGKCNDCGEQYKRSAGEVERGKTGLCDGCYALNQKHNAEGGK